MKKIRIDSSARRFGAAGATLALIAVLVTGCGSSTGGAAHSTSPASSQAAATGVQTATPISRSTPVSFKISSINASGSLISVGLNSDGSVQVPANYVQAGWYQKGPAPGEQGSAVILGHVDSYKGVGVFFYLRKVKPGDTIDVARADGKTAHFKVTDVRIPTSWSTRPSPR